MATYAPRSRHEFPDSIQNRPIWACAYDFNNDDDRARLRQKPVKGVIRRDGRRFVFYILKKDGGPRQNGVSANSRVYADTYEECVELYNQKVQARIDRLQAMIQSTTKDFL